MRSPRISRSASGAPFLGGGHQFLRGLEARERRHQDVGKLAERNDGSKIPYGIVGQPRIGRRCDRMHRGVDQQRISITFGFGDGGHAESAAGTRPALEHHGLADLMRHRVENRPRNRVDCAAGRERRYELDRLPRRPRLPVRPPGRHQPQKDKHEERVATHRVLRGERAVCRKDYAGEEGNAQIGRLLRCWALGLSDQVD